MIEDAIYSRNL